MGVEEWVKKQGWKKRTTAKGERYYCRFSHPRVGWFVSGRVLFANDADLLKDHYKRYLENKLREAFGFFGTPIRISVRERKEKKS